MYCPWYNSHQLCIDPLTVQWLLDLYNFQVKRKQLFTFNHISPCFKNRTISRHKKQLNFPPLWIGKPVYTNPDNELTLRNIQNCLFSRVLVCLRRKAHLSLVHGLLFANAESLQIFESRRGTWALFESWRCW